MSWLTEKRYWGLEVRETGELVWLADHPDVLVSRWMFNSVALRKPPDVKTWMAGYEARCVVCHLPIIEPLHRFVLRDRTPELAPEGFPGINVYILHLINEIDAVPAFRVHDSAELELAYRLLPLTPFGPVTAPHSRS